MRRAHVFFFLFAAWAAGCGGEPGRSHHDDDDSSSGGDGGGGGGSGSLSGGSGGSGSGSGGAGAGGPVSCSVHVQDMYGVPVPSLPVLVADAAGSVTEESFASASGDASVVVPAGGSVTVIYGKEVYTALDVPGGAVTFVIEGSTLGDLDPPTTVTASWYPILEMPLAGLACSPSVSMMHEPTNMGFIGKVYAYRGCRGSLDFDMALFVYDDAGVLEMGGWVFGVPFVGGQVSVDGIDMDPVAKATVQASVTGATGATQWGASVTGVHQNRPLFNRGNGAQLVGATAQASIEIATAPFDRWQLYDSVVFPDGSKVMRVDAKDQLPATTTFAADAVGRPAIGPQSFSADEVLSFTLASGAGDLVQLVATQVTSQGLLERRWHVLSPPPPDGTLRLPTLPSRYGDLTLVDGPTSSYRMTNLDLLAADGYGAVIAAGVFVGELGGPLLLDFDSDRAYTAGYAEHLAL